MIAIRLNIQRWDQAQYVITRIVDAESAARWFLKDRRRPPLAALNVSEKVDEGGSIAAKCFWQDESEAEFEEECQRQQDEAYEAYLRRYY